MEHRSFELYEFLQAALTTILTQQCFGLLEYVMGFRDWQGNSLNLQNQKESKQFDQHAFHVVCVGDLSRMLPLKSLDQRMPDVFTFYEVQKSGWRGLSFLFDILTHHNSKKQMHM